MGVVVDSSLFIAAERGRFDWVGFHSQLGAEPLYLTVITLAELLHGAERADTPERRATRRQFIAEVEARYPLLSFGRDEAIEVRCVLGGSARGYAHRDARPPDCGDCPAIRLPCCDAQ